MALVVNLYSVSDRMSLYLGSWNPFRFAAALIGIAGWNLFLVGRALVNPIWGRYLFKRKGSKYPTFEASVFNHALHGFLGPETSNIGYSDPLGKVCQLRRPNDGS